MRQRPKVKGRLREKLLWCTEGTKQNKAQQKQKIPL